MRWILWMCGAALALAQGTDPKAKPEDYPVHAQAHSGAIGAEFMVHSFNRGELSYTAKDYLVVEVAVFPPKGGNVEVRDSGFTLRINGKKQVLFAVAPSLVATSLQHPEWTPGPSVEADAGVGPAVITMGGPPINRNPFPGAPPVTRMPVPRTDDPDHPGSVKPAERTRPEELVVETALPEGSYHGAVSGFLYFPYKGKIRSLMRVELLWDDAALKLR